MLGLERELREKSAGLKTHILVAVAAATFTLITLRLWAEFGQGEDRNSDPIRIIEAVTAGVAFLGAGAIIQQRRAVVGLTTGAAVWLSGAVGVACGAGYFGLGALATAVALAVLVLVSQVERRWLSPGDGSPDRRD